MAFRPIDSLSSLNTFTLNQSSSLVPANQKPSYPRNKEEAEELYQTFDRKMSPPLAISYLTEIVFLNPENIFATIELAEWLKETNEEAQAEHSMKQALNICLEKKYLPGLLAIASLFRERQLYKLILSSVSEESRAMTAYLLWSLILGTDNDNADHLITTVDLLYQTNTQFEYESFFVAHCNSWLRRASSKNRPLEWSLVLVCSLLKRHNCSYKLRKIILEALEKEKTTVGGAYLELAELLLLEKNRDHRSRAEALLTTAATYALEIQQKYCAYLEEEEALMAQKKWPHDHGGYALSNEDRLYGPMAVHKVLLENKMLPTLRKELLEARIKKDPHDNEASVFLARLLLSRKANKTDLERARALLQQAGKEILIVPNSTRQLAELYELLSIYHWLPEMRLSLLKALSALNSEGSYYDFLLASFLLSDECLVKDPETVCELLNFVMDKVYEGTYQIDQIEKIRDLISQHKVFPEEKQNRVIQDLQQIIRSSPRNREKWLLEFGEKHK